MLPNLLYRLLLWIVFGDGFYYDSEYEASIPLSGVEVVGAVGVV